MHHTKRSGAFSTGLVITLGSLVAIAVLVFLLANPFDQRSHAGKTIVFDCAAGMKKPVQEIIRQYESQYGVTVRPTYGGSGAMLEKIKLHGGDLFLSADSFHMNLGLKGGDIKETIPIAILKPTLVVHRAKQTALEKEGAPIAALEDALREDLKIVIANPTTTAVGRLSKEMFEKAGLWDALEARKANSNKVVWQATVNLVAEAVSLDENSIGIIWDATAHEYPNLQMIATPEAEGISEIMSIGVAAKSRDAAAALHFARYLSARDKGLPLFAKNHFQPIPDADVWVDKPQLVVFSGAMLQDGMVPVLSEFKLREGVHITSEYKGCGILVTEMDALRGRKNFPDMYVACDTTFADRVKNDFEAAQSILQNDVVFVVKRGNPKKVKPELTELERTDLKTGVPHPKHSAMGKIIDDLLKSRRVNARLDTVQNSGHALITQMLAGSLDLAVVGRSNARNSEESEENLEVIDIAGPILTQTIQIAKDSPQKHLLERLRNAITTPESLERFKRLGFRTVP